MIISQPGSGYTRRKFKQRLGMNKDLFLKVLGKLLEVDEEWHQHLDATGNMGILHMELVVVMKYLCKITFADNIDNYTVWE